MDAVRACQRARAEVNTHEPRSQTCDMRFISRSSMSTMFEFQSLAAAHVDCRLQRR
jgi:hypothetical protein